MPGTTGAIPGMIMGGAMPGKTIPPIWSKRGFLAAGSSSTRPARVERKKKVENETEMIKNGIPAV